MLIVKHDYTNIEFDYFGMFNGCGSKLKSKYKYP